MTSPLICLLRWLILFLIGCFQSPSRNPFRGGVGSKAFGGWSCCCFGCGIRWRSAIWAFDRLQWLELFQKFSKLFTQKKWQLRSNFYEFSSDKKGIKMSQYFLKAQIYKNHIENFPWNWRELSLLSIVSDNLYLGRGLGRDDLNFVILDALCPHRLQLLLHILPNILQQLVHQIFPRIALVFEWARDDFFKANHWWLEKGLYFIFEQKSKSFIKKTIQSNFTLVR